MHSADSTHASFLHRLGHGGEAWDGFHARYGELLYRYARARGASHDDAEDAVQDVEMQFFRAADGFRYEADKGRFRAYLRTAVIHALSRKGRRDARQPGGLDPAALAQVGPEAAETDPLWERELKLRRLREAVEAVADEFDLVTRKAFEMHVLAGRTVNQTADELGISKWRVYRARDRMIVRIRETLADGDSEVRR